MLPDEIATALSYAHPLSVRPFTGARKYDASNLDLQKAGNEMGVSVLITGHFLTEQGKLQLTYEAVDVADDHILWRDTIALLPIPVVLATGVATFFVVQLVPPIH